MKYVSELYSRHAGQDIYVVGTGASLRVFPKDFFKGKTVVGLNQAWRMVDVTYGITIHPDLNIPEFLAGEKARPEILWLTGHKKAKALLNATQMEHAEKNFYFFNYHGRENTAPENEPSTAGRVIEWVEKPTENNLYVWSSISQAGVNLAANLGAKNIILVGCDNASLGENHHSHGQHTRWKGVDPNHRYQQYYEGLTEVRQALRKKNVNLVSMNPFLKLDDPMLEFSKLCAETGQPISIQEPDVSPKKDKKKKGWLNWLST